MEVHKLAWESDSILKQNSGQHRNDAFCGFENIQSAMRCSGILGSGGTAENGFVGLCGKSEMGNLRSGGGAGNVIGAGYSGRRQTSAGGNFSSPCESTKSHLAQEYSRSSFSSWDHRNPLLEGMMVKPSQNNDMVDVGQFSPSSGVNCGPRQTLDDLVSKILDEDTSTKQSDDFCGGLDEKKFSLGVPPITNTDYSANMHNIWSSDGKTVSIQSQQLPANSAFYSNADLLKSVLDGNWEAARTVPGFLQTQIMTNAGFRAVENGNMSQRRPVSGFSALETHNLISQGCVQKTDAGVARNMDLMEMETNAAEVELALRCLEKSLPFSTSQHKQSDLPFPIEAWSKVSNVCLSQNSAGPRGITINSYPSSAHSHMNPNTNVARYSSQESLLAEMKSTIRNLIGPSIQLGSAEHQYLAQCLAQSHESFTDDRPKNTFYNGTVNNVQNGLMSSSSDRRLTDQNLIFAGNLEASAINGQNNYFRHDAKNTVWPSKTVPGYFLPTSPAVTAEKRECHAVDMNPQVSYGGLFMNQNQQFGYLQSTDKKPTYLPPNFVPCQTFPMHLNSDMNQNSDNSSMLNHVHDAAIFQQESMISQQQQQQQISNGFRYDITSMPKVTQPTHISVRLIDSCECNAQCDAHNMGRVAPVILGPGDIFYNSIPPPPVFGLSQYIPDMKYQRCFNSSGALLLCLEECFEQLRNLEKEEKQVENELMQNNLGRCLASVNSTAIPRLPHNPSRVNRLVVESLREHSRVTAILGKMKKIRNQPLHANIYSAMETWMEGIRKVQARRKEEIVSSANRSNSGGSRAQEEKDILALMAAVEELLGHTRRARTALWCALQISLYSIAVSPISGSIETDYQDSPVFFHSPPNEWQQLGESEAYVGQKF